MEVARLLLEASSRDFIVVHTSDVHVDDDYAAAQFGGDGTQQLRRVVKAASRLRADILLLVGDTFDHNRLPGRVVEQAATALAEFSGTIVVLPGNHDPAMEDSIYRHPAIGCLEHVRVLGVGCEETVRFAELQLEICGRPHRDFSDMAPLAALPSRKDRWRIVMAHGHYEPQPDYRVWPRPCWLFGDADLAATDADYVALGHWNRTAQVGAGAMQAWYSGSPDYAQTVNLLRFRVAQGLTISREAIDE